MQTGKQNDIRLQARVQVFKFAEGVNPATGQPYEIVDRIIPLSDELLSLTPEQKDALLLGKWKGLSTDATTGCRS